MKLTQRLMPYVLVPTLGLGGLGGCATTEGTNYSRDRNMGHTERVVRGQMLDYASENRAFQEAMENGTYDPNCPKGVIAEMRSNDAKAQGLTMVVDAAILYSLCKSLKGDGSSGSGDKGGNPFEPGTVDGENGCVITGGC